MNILSWTVSDRFDPFFCFSNEVLSVSNIVSCALIFDISKELPDPTEANSSYVLLHIHSVCVSLLFRCCNV